MSEKHMPSERTMRIVAGIVRELKRRKYPPTKGDRYTVDVPLNLTAIELEDINQGVYHECCDWFGEFDASGKGSLVRLENVPPRIVFTFKPGTHII